jgi:copper chaperone CopZ
VDGILRVDINYILDSVTVEYDADKLTSAQIRKKLALRTYAPVMRQDGPGADSKAKPAWRS